MPSKLSDRLMEASRRLFVGRTNQRKLFEKALLADALPFNLLHIFGPGGIGKTSLLYEYKRVCEERRISVTYLDARMIEADPVAFLSGLQAVFGGNQGEKPADQMGQEGRHVLMIDTFELFYSLEQWLYNEFFTTLTDEVLIVVAGRYPPSTIWQNHPGWQSLTRVVALRNLSPDDTRDFLNRIALPGALHDTVVKYTHGHPLALSLVADSFVQRPDVAFTPALGADFIKVLLDRFVRDVPSTAHREALEACALVNHLTESLLSSMLDTEDVNDVFEWLRNLSFIEAGPRGIFPHDLAREILGAESKWRNPDLHRSLHKRARQHYNERLHKASTEEQGLILADYIFLHRDHPIVQPFFIRLREIQDADAPVSSDRYRPGDEEEIVETVRKHEGDAAAKIAQHWLEIQPEQVIVYRNLDGSVDGFLFMIALDGASKQDLVADPVAQKALMYIQNEAPLRPGERATLFRFWMESKSYQQISRVQSMIFVNMVRHYLTTPNLAYSLLPIAMPDYWEGIFAYADLHRIGALDEIIEEVPYGTFGHDWRKRPPAAWLDLLASRESGSGTVKAEPAASLPRPILVLSEEAFAEATRDALRDFTRPYALKDNPLISSRIVTDHVDEEADDEQRISRLVELLTESLAALEENKREEKAYRAVYRTYVKPAPSQEQASELLGIPYSTFRRHLTRGVKEITDLLWRREVGI